MEIVIDMVKKYNSIENLPIGNMNQSEELEENIDHLTILYNMMVKRHSEIPEDSDGQCLDSLDYNIYPGLMNKIEEE